MRWLTFDRNGQGRPGVLVGDDTVVDIGAAATAVGGREPHITSLEDLCAAPPAVRRQLEDVAAGTPEPTRLPLSGLRLRPPIERPGKIVCLAGNYREHIVESGFTDVSAEDVITPQMFLKPATCLAGHDAEIRLGARNRTVGWEVELAIVVGAGGSDISEPEAMKHVFGYTVLNDLSERAVNAGIPGRRVRERDPFFDWQTGKWFDGFAPCGPWIVPSGEIPDPHALDLRLSVNSELRQEGNTGAMIFRIPRLIAEISSIMTLEPGDLIATGTPAGAGTGFGNAFLSEGDSVLCEISGIGKLRNRIGSRR